MRCRVNTGLPEMVRNQANDDLLNTNVANPYSIRNLAPLQTSNPVLYKLSQRAGILHRKQYPAAPSAASLWLHEQLLLHASG